VDKNSNLYLLKEDLIININIFNKIYTLGFYNRYNKDLNFSIK